LIFIEIIISHQRLDTEYDDTEYDTVQAYTILNTTLNTIPQSPQKRLY